MNTAKNPAPIDTNALKTTNLKTLEGYCFGFDGSKCEECGGKCCAGESGYVFLSIAEMQEIARFLGIEFEVFTQKYVRKVRYKFSLLEKIPKIENILHPNTQDSLNSNQHDRIQDSYQPKNTEYEREAEPSGIHFREGDTINGIGAEFTSAKTIQSNIESQNPNQRDRILQSCQPKNAEYARETQWSGGEAEFTSAKTIQSNIECIFFENGKCAIYPVRPKQCRDFPFWESHKILDADSKKALSLECKGITFFS